MKDMKNLKKQTSNLTLQNSLLNPWFITGFTDGEGCFYIRITKKNQMKIG